MTCFDNHNTTVPNILSNYEIIPLVPGSTSLLRYCEWKGKPISCSAIFSTFPTDKGMCCSFNMKKAEDIFNGETYSGLVQTMQARDKNLSFIDPKLENYYQENGQLKIQPGKSKGLTVILDSHSDFYAAGSLEDDTKGFLGTIHPTGNFPMTTTGSFELRPGPAFLFCLCYNFRYFTN